MATLLRSSIRVGSLFCLSISLLKKIIFLLETTTYSFFQPCRLMFCLLGVWSQPSRLASVSPSSVSVPTESHNNARPMQ